MIDPSPAASPTDEEEYPQADGRRCKANDQKDTSNSTLVVEEPITKRNSISYVMHHVQGTYWVVLARSSALSVGFAITSVKVAMPPLLKVEVKVEVISRGANDVTCPRLLVV
jgi:hypothetical protein